MSDNLTYSYEIYRQGGHWKIVLNLPQWIYQDIQEAGLPVIIVGDSGLKVGYSSYQNRHVFPYLLSNAKFEEIDPKKNDGNA